MSLMVPGPWAGIVLALAAFRLTRLLGWDTWPPLVWLRARVTGEVIYNSGSTNARQGTTAERVKHVYTYRRPIIADLFACPYCLGAWISLTVYACWVFAPRWTMYACVPAAVSAFVGAWSRWLDP